MGILALLLLASATPCQQVAWVWVTPTAGTNSWTPSQSYSYIDSGGTPTCTRNATLPHVTEVFLPTIPHDGFAHVCSHQSTGHITSVFDVAAAPGGTVVSVATHEATSGAPLANRPFVLRYTTGAPSGTRQFHCYAEFGSAVAHLPTRYHNPAGGAPVVTPTGPGRTTVRIPGMSPTGLEFGTVQLSVRGSSAAGGVVDSWQASGGDLLVHLRFHTHTGAATATPFYLSYQERAAPIATVRGSGSHLLANQQFVTVPYGPAAAFTDSNGNLGPTGQERITRIGLGIYDVHLPDHAAIDSSSAFAVAYGLVPARAVVRSWTLANPGTTVRVYTCDPAGNPIDARFLLSYLTNRPADLTAFHDDLGGGCPGIELDASPDPVSTASTGVTLTYALTGLPTLDPTTSVRAGVLAISFAQGAGTPLVTWQSQPCLLHIGSLDITLPFLGVGGGYQIPFALPAGLPSGLTFYSQAASVTTATSFGLALSNGLRSVVREL